ncbi:MAG: DUF4339 domain-containing protein, partial [Planctomycetaceae bacterium]|nr:DUF4339 domain-containing protein [Planctomycetaceae bacterium]
SLPAFLHNFMGSRQQVQVADVEAALEPLVQRAVWEFVGQLSIEDLVQEGIARRMADQVDTSLQAAFSRYGLNFVDIQIVEARHEKFDELQQKTGEAWLIRRGIEQQAALDEVYSEQERMRLYQQEREHELRVLAAQVETDALRKRLSARLDRIDVQNQIRETLNSEKLARLESREQLKNELLELDRKRLLRKEELDELVEGFKQRKEDRGTAREAVVAIASLQRGRELEELREEIDHASRLKAVEHEIALAKTCATRDNEAWQRELEREAAEAEHRRTERRKKLEEQWQLVGERNEHRRLEDWQDVVHQQRVQQTENELEVARAETARRVALLERETSRQSSDDQMDRMARLQELNAARDRQLAELAERRADGESTRELRKLEIMGGMNAKALIATANVDNAALLASVEQQEAKSAADTDRQQLYERLTEAERAKADAIAATFREAMQFQQQTVDQVIQSGRNGNPGSGAAAPPPPAVETRWWVSEGGQPTGPFSLAELQSQAASGRLTSSTWLCAAGENAWRTAAEAVPQVLQHTPPPPFSAGQPAG